MKILYKNKHWNIVEDYNIDKILYLLIDRPTRIDYNNEHVWTNKKIQWHRGYDLPAYISNDGHVEWYKYSNLHRDKNKPARIWNNGYKTYYINGFIEK